MLVWSVVTLGVGALVAAVRLPRPLHRVALGVASVALVLAFWPVACSTALASGPARSAAVESTSCTSATGLRLPGTAGVGIAVGGLVLLGGAWRTLRRRPRTPDDRDDDVRSR